MELLFLLSLIGNIFTLFHDQWYFSELALLSFSGAYAALLVYLYNRRGTHNLDKSFRPFFIGAFIINLILVILMLTEFSIYFDNPLMLPIFIIYFILTLALAGMAFLHFNSVATSQSLHLLGFIVGIIMADVLRFLDHYYYNSASLQLGALFLYSGGYYLAYRRMVIYAEHKTRKYILQEVSEIKNE